MFTSISKKMIMFLTLLTLVLYPGSAYGRGGGGGFHDEGGSFHSGNDSRSGDFHSDGGFHNSGFRGDAFNRETSGGSFNRGMTGGTFNRSIGSSGGWAVSGREEHFGGERFGSRDFDRGRSFDHDRGHFDRDFHHDHDFDHHRFFFNPFFDFVFVDPFFYPDWFYNPYVGGYYGSPYYYYDPWYGGGYGPVPGGNSYTYNYYSNPIQNATTLSTGNATAPTPAESYFQEGVRMFGNGQYKAASEKFGAAKSLVPQDKVLPFAYAQAVFASGDYVSAAAALREAVAKVNPETEGIFYPRGMYPNEATIQQQIKTLTGAVTLNKSNAGLQLLLGYNELGMGNLDKAEVALTIASADPTNGPIANALLKMVNKLRTTTQTPKPENNTSGTSKTQGSTTGNIPPQTPQAEAPAY